MSLSFLLDVAVLVVVVGCLQVVAVKMMWLKNKYYVCKFPQ
jgi:hypothetical protein